MISKPTLFTCISKKQKTLTNIDKSTFVSVSSFLKLTHFYLEIPVVGVEPTLLTEHDFESCASANSATPAYYGGGNRIRTGGKGFADLCLTTWLCRHLLTIWSGRRDSNPRPPPWQGGVLPLNYFRILAGLAGFEPTNDGVKVRCLTAWL